MPRLRYKRLAAKFRPYVAQERICDILMIATHVSSQDGLLLLSPPYNILHNNLRTITWKLWTGYSSTMITYKYFLEAGPDFHMACARGPLNKIRCIAPVSQPALHFKC
jgi:hypothetical protein